VNVRHLLIREAPLSRTPGMSFRPTRRNAVSASTGHTVFASGGVAGVEVAALPHAAVAREATAAR